MAHMDPVVAAYKSGMLNTLTLDELTKAKADYEQQIKQYPNNIPDSATRKERDTKQCIKLAIEAEMCRKRRAILEKSVKRKPGRPRKNPLPENQDI